MRGAILLQLYLLGNFVLFLGERYFGPAHPWRLPVSLAGGGIVLLALLLRFVSFVRAAGERRRALARMIPAWLAGCGGLLLYALTLPERPFPLDDAVVDLLELAWPMAWLAGSIPLFFMEMSLRGMWNAPRLETRRLFEAGIGGLTIALALSWLVALNFTADKKDRRIDLRTLKDLLPSGATEEMVRNLDAPVTVSLLFPPANDVAERIEPYFGRLSALSPKIELERVDVEMQPKRARELKARENGTVILSRGDRHESIRLDTDPERARRKLKTLDREFQKRLAKVVRDPFVAYVVTGHGERSLSPGRDDPPGLRDLKEMLSFLNYKVKKLGLKEGLSEAVPGDATVVIVAGPTTPLLEAEVESLVAYVKGGGGLLLFLDPERERDPEIDPLLATLGVTFSPEILANETQHIRFTRGKKDRAFLFTNQISRHDSTTTLKKLGLRGLVLFYMAGSVEKEAKAEGAKVEVTVRSLPGTWADLDGNFEFDADSEKRAVHPLTVAVELPSDDPDHPGGRAIVAADVDMVSDLILRKSPGNQQWLADALRWLEREVKLSGEVAEIEDVPVLHTQEEDKAWFYGTILGVPLLILVFGFFVSGIGRKGRGSA